MPRPTPETIAAAEHGLLTLERLVAEGAGSVADLTLYMHGPGFRSGMDPNQLRRLEAVQEGIRRLDGSDTAAEDLSPLPGMR